MLAIARRYLTLIALLLVVACVSAPIKQTPVSPPISPLNTLTSTATPAPTPTSPPTITPTPLPIVTPTPAGSAIPTPAGVAPPAGLLYRTYDGYGLWRINLDGQTKKILANISTFVSSDGTHAIYNEQDVFWIIDLVNGNRYNLTQAIGRHVCCYRWYPARPNNVFFNTWQISKCGPIAAGFLAMANSDGSQSQVIDPQHCSYTVSALSPDGQTIAYDRKGQAWFYRFEGGFAEFDPQSYGMRNLGDLMGPSWAPDGRHLAWVVFDGALWGFAIFDLKDHSGHVLHWHKSTVFEGVPEPVTWSPDGKWMAFMIYADDPNATGLWVASVDGNREHRIENGTSHVVWSPDSRWLAFDYYSEPNADPRIWIVEVGAWHMQPVNLPQTSSIVGWVTLPK